MTRGKVVLGPFPFDDFSATKVRPAVCLTDAIGVHRHVVLAFITSRMPDELLETDVVLDSGRVGYSATGLRVSSVRRLHRLMTVATSVIRRELGSLLHDIQAEVDRKLLKLFELDKAAKHKSIRENYERPCCDGAVRRTCGVAGRRCHGSRRREQGATFMSTATKEFDFMEREKFGKVVEAREGRIKHWRYIPELGHHLLVVTTADGALFNAFDDSNYTRKQRRER